MSLNVRNTSKNIKPTGGILTIDTGNASKNINYCYNIYIELCYVVPQKYVCHELNQMAGNQT